MGDSHGVQMILNVFELQGDNLPLLYHNRRDLPGQTRQCK